MDIRAEKIKLMEWLNSLSDQSVIEKLMAIKEAVSTSKDWYTLLSEEEKQSIQKGLSDVEKGNVSPHIYISKKYGKDE